MSQVWPQAMAAVFQWQHHLATNTARWQQTNYWLSYCMCVYVICILWVPGRVAFWLKASPTLKWLLIPDFEAMTYYALTFRLQCSSLGSQCQCSLLYVVTCIGSGCIKMLPDVGMVWITTKFLPLTHSKGESLWFLDSVTTESERITHKYFRLKFMGCQSGTYKHTKHTHIASMYTKSALKHT